MTETKIHSLSQIRSGEATITFKRDAEIFLREHWKSRDVSFSKGDEVKGSLEIGLASSILFFLKPNVGERRGDEKVLVLPNIYKVLSLVDIAYPERGW